MLAKGIITDHAVIRYMERVMGFNVEQVRTSMISKELRAAIKAGATKYKTDGVEYRLGQGKVITVTVDNEKQPEISLEG